MKIDESRIPVIRKLLGHLSESYGSPKISEYHRKFVRNRNPNHYHYFITKSLEHWKSEVYSQMSHDPVVAWWSKNGSPDLYHVFPFPDYIIWLMKKEESKLQKEFINIENEHLMEILKS